MRVDKVQRKWLRSRCLKDESRQGTTKVVEVIFFTTSTQSLDTTWMWGWSLSSNWAQDSFCIGWVANAKFVFRGSCEASGSLFRIKKLKFFQNFLKNSGDCSYIASTILLVKPKYSNVFFFCFRQLYTFYYSSIHHLHRFHRRFQHILFWEGLIVLTCIVFYDVYHLQPMRMRRRRKKMKSFHQFVF